MGAYGTPEHLPGENQESNFQYGYSDEKQERKFKNNLKPWQKVSLVFYLCIVAFFELLMLVGLTNYSGNKTTGMVSAGIFLILSVLFITKIKKHKKAWPFFFCSLVAFFAYFGGMSGAQSAKVTPAQLQSSRVVSDVASETQSTGNPAETNLSSMASSSTNSINEEEQYKEQCKVYQYKPIARKPNDYKGKLAKFTGKVTQIEEAWGSDIILLSVTKDEYGFWNDNLYVEYTPKSKDEIRILEDDIITVYGELNGIKTYITVLGNSVSIPYFKAQYVDIAPESK